MDGGHSMSDMTFTSIERLKNNDFSFDTEKQEEVTK